MLLSPYGRREWLTLLIGGAIGVGLLGWLGWWWPATAVAIVCMALLAFFRDPPRRATHYQRHRKRAWP